MALTAGLILDCEDPPSKRGGAKHSWFINSKDVLEMTETAVGSGIFDTITLEASKFWFEYETFEDTLVFRENVEGEKGNYQVTQEIEFVVPPLSVTNRNALQALMDASDCGLIGCVEDANGTFWITGYSVEYEGKKPLRVASDATTTQALFSEQAGSTVILRAISPTKAYTTTAQIVTE